MRRQGRITAGVIGATGSLLLHWLFLAAAMWGWSHSARFPDRPEAIGAGANLGKPEGDTAERRMIVRLLSKIEPEEPRADPNAYLDELLKQALQLDITGPDPLPLPPLIVDRQGEPAESSDAELMARAKMLGIYESQIRARIERAWTLPAESLTEQVFTCRVLIRQHANGRVNEVELPYEECDGSPAMRQSLAEAIFTASPLPAPPHPGVFVDSFWLVFRSESVRAHAALTDQHAAVVNSSRP